MIFYNPYYPNSKTVNMSWSDAISNVFEFGTALLKIRRAGDQIKNVVAIYDNMNYVLARTPAERFLVLKAHNGGGIVRPGESLYGSIIYEDYRAPLTSVKAAWQGFEFDSEYLKLITNVYADGHSRIHTTRLNRGILKNALESVSIRYSEMYFLHQNKKASFYCTISTTKDENFDHPAHRNEITIAVNNIRNLLKK